MTRWEDMTRKVRDEELSSVNKEVERHFGCCYVAIPLRKRGEPNSPLLWVIAKGWEKGNKGEGATPRAALEDALRKAAEA